MANLAARRLGSKIRQQLTSTVGSGISAVHIQSAQWREEGVRQEEQEGQEWRQWMQQIESSPEATGLTGAWGDTFQTKKTWYGCIYKISGGY